MSWNPFKRTPKQHRDAPPDWAPFFRSGAAYAAFERCVGDCLRQAGVDAVIIDGVAHHADSQRRWGLLNLAQHCASTPQSDWPAAISKHVAVMLRAESETPGDGVVPRLVVRLWDANDLPDDVPSLSRELMPGIRAVLAADLPESIRTIRPDEAARWAIPEDDLFRRAIDTVVESTPLRFELEEIAPGISIRLYTSDQPYFVASTALRPALLDDAMGLHGAFVSVPVREGIFALPFTQAADAQYLGPLCSLTAGMYRDGPGSVSPRVFWLFEGRYHEIRYELGKRLTITPPPELVRRLNAAADSGANDSRGR